MHRCLAGLGLILPVALLLSPKKPPIALLSQLESELKDPEFTTKLILGSTYEYCMQGTQGVMEIVRFVDTEVSPDGAANYRVRMSGETQRPGCTSGKVVSWEIPYPDHPSPDQLTSLLPVGTRVRVTKVEIKPDRIEFWLNGSEGKVLVGPYAKLKLMLGKGFEKSYDLDAVLNVVSRALRLERFERLQALKAEYPELQQTLRTAEGRFKTVRGDARSRLHAARQFENALQALVKNRTDYDSLTQTASDPERDQYARQAAELDRAIQALEGEAKKERAGEIRKVLSTDAEEATRIRAQLQQRKPSTLAEWEQQMTSLRRCEEVLHNSQTLHKNLAEVGEAPSASEQTALQQGFQEIQALRATLEGQRQGFQLAELDKQYREMDRTRRQLMDAYTRAFGTPRQRPEGEKLYIHLHHMNENRIDAQNLGSEQAQGQAAGLQKEMERLNRQIGPVQVPVRSTAPASTPTRPPSPKGSAAPPPAVPGSAGPKRIRVGGNVMAGNLVFQPEGEYPPLAKMAGIEGTVRMEVVINTDGTVQDVKVLSGHPLLVKAAIEAISRWRYQPMLLQGRPVEVLTEVEQEFKLPEVAARPERGAQSSSPIAEAPSEALPATSESLEEYFDVSAQRKPLEYSLKVRTGNKIATGKMLVIVTGEEEINGKSYVKEVTTFSSVSGLPSRVEYARKAHEGVYVIKGNDPTRSEYLQVPYPVRIGIPWTDLKGTTYRIESIETIELNGQIYDDCLRVVIKTEQWEAVSHLAKKIGMIKSIQKAGGTIIEAALESSRQAKEPETPQ